MHNMNIVFVAGYLICVCDCVEFAHGFHKFNTVHRCVVVTFQCHSALYANKSHIKEPICYYWWLLGFVGCQCVCVCIIILYMYCRYNYTLDINYTF